ncbi:MAG: OprO/OprP family phosphate-selective porin [Bacteroides sp.]|nr:OprO/OprP family phosphate-selective porin [Bacteroides sp.]MCM1447957.1 OprO/OprP family phosphate-selective porin [Bacteroides sp.]MCM1516517.1 OprO/OprP family phosphate-selective porin [Paraprevotella sp.]
MKRTLILLAVACAWGMGVRGAGADSLSVHGERSYEGPEIRRFSVETRMGWQMQRSAGVTDDNRTGFRGEYINMYLFARLYKGLSFKWRQRLNITNERNFWDSTDYMMMQYEPDRHWRIAAGKQVVAIGGYEYDRPGIDLYYNSEYWNNISCYQLGASVAYTFNSGDCLTLQFCNSPFRKAIGSNNTYGLSLMWNGTHGCWESIWSLNAFQCTGGRWMSYMALGNRFNLMSGGRLWMEVDYVNRASSHQTIMFKDCSVVAELSGRPHPTTRLFAKYTYDTNRSGTDADLCVLDGTEIHGISGGVEYEPFRQYPDVLRLYGTAGYDIGTNSNPDGVLKDGLVCVNVGVKLNLDILHGLRWALKRR